LLLQSLHEHNAAIDGDLVVHTWPVRRLDLRYAPFQGLKAAITDMLQLVAANYRREQRGQPVQHVAMNRVLLGNPGTGKTTVRPFVMSTKTSQTGATR
jgi:Cdc6-like AAA superfamily ATPase